MTIAAASLVLGVAGYAFWRNGHEGYASLAIIAWCVMVSL